MLESLLEALEKSLNFHQTRLYEPEVPNSHRLAHFIFQGIMALVLYAVLRNPCLVQCFAPQKVSSYAVSANLYDPTHIQQHTSPGEGQYQFHPSALDVGSLKGSRASLLNEVNIYCQCQSL